MDNVPIVSSILPMLMWVQQGIIIEDMKYNMEGELTDLFFSFPASFNMKDREGNDMTTLKLKRSFSQLASKVYPSNVTRHISTRDEEWDTEKGRQAVHDTLQNMIASGMMEMEY